MSPVLFALVLSGGLSCRSRGAHNSIAVKRGVARPAANHPKRRRRLAVAVSQRAAWVTDSVRPREETVGDQ